MTLPIKDYEVVIGKYLASFCLLGVTILLLPIHTHHLSLTLGSQMEVLILGGYIGLCLMGGAYLAIGMFASTITENQIVAFILGIVMCFGLLIIGEDIVLFNAPNWIVPIFSYLRLGCPFQQQF